MKRINKYETEFKQTKFQKRKEKENEANQR